ncbi:MAG: 5-(carboxyamino)imidazole ribonucleotide mutase [bacterium]|nr:5-(carboxyamino)imidazole ribonucleotide mutase [bacterium]MDD5353758.1 5-(carboxyamino)imidazole ribonucleotide mutase [bacterium]MDD5757204.1 5-(carboxyamino)imidazole ribonucleotide mutase [bacterium]
MKYKVAIVMGSESDLEIMNEAAKTLKEFGICYELKVMSAHRTPKAVANFSGNAERNGFGVVIAGAGKAAHLPGVIAAYTQLPVIGVPIKTKDLGGLDSLLSIVQMPNGVPVATVAINGAKNAAILACQILAINNQALKNKLRAFKKRLTSRSRK